MKKINSLMSRSCLADNGQGEVIGLETERERDSRNRGGIRFYPSSGNCSLCPQRAGAIVYNDISKVTSRSARQTDEWCV